MLALLRKHGLHTLDGQDILDVGCGDGALTERFHTAGCVVVAIDSSPEQVWAALERGLDARIIDACELEFETEFDAVFSNAVLHWIKDADAVLRGVHRALRPGGRFVAEMGGPGCVASIRGAFQTALSRRGIDAANEHGHPTMAEEFERTLEGMGS